MKNHKYKRNSQSTDIFFITLVSVIFIAVLILTILRELK